MNKHIYFGSCIALMLSSCQANNKNISIFFYDSNDAIGLEMTESLQKQLTDTNLNFYYAQKSLFKQSEQIEQSLIGKNDLLIVNCVDSLSSNTIIEKCKKANTPILFFNGEPLKEDLEKFEKCYYVGSNPIEQGTIQANFISSFFGSPGSLNNKYDLNNDNKIQLIVFKGEQGHQDAEKRTSSAISRLTELGYTIEILGIEVANWSREQAYSIMERLYEKTFQKAELIISNNDEMAIGIINYLKMKNYFLLDKLIPIIGVDATIEGKEYVDKGYLKATVINDSAMQTYALKELTYSFLKKDYEIDNSVKELMSGKFIYTSSKLYTKQ